jgi:hypothetical protein
MNATLGVTGFTVGTFESTALISGLTITLSGGVPLTTFSSLPALFDQTVCGSLSDNSTWDGTHGVINTTTNSLSNCNSPANIADLTTFNYGPGATSFGIGFGNFQSLAFTQIPITNHELFVNGGDMGVLETLAGSKFTPGLARNAYLRIDGTAGTTITSVAIQNLTNPDVLVFDHVAVQQAVTAVPEPSPYSTMLVGASLLFIGLAIRKTNRV